MQIDIDYLEDMRVLCQSRAIGMNGGILANQYTRMLGNQAADALHDRDIESAHRLNERIRVFNSKFFG